MTKERRTLWEVLKAPMRGRIPAGRKSIDPKEEEASPYAGFVNVQNQGGAEDSVCAILQKLKSKATSIEKIKYLSRATPEVGMAVWSLLRLASQGHKAEFYEGKHLDEETGAMWRAFAESVGESGLGMDGVELQMFWSLFVGGGVGVEVVVSEDRKRVENVVVLPPETLAFQYERVGDETVAVPYQHVAGRDPICLGKGEANFFWIALDPEPGVPYGYIPLESSIYPTTLQLELQQIITKVLRHQGFPRYDVTIDLEKLMTLKDPRATDGAELMEWLQKMVTTIGNRFHSLDPDSSVVHTNDTQVSTLTGAGSAHSVDFRAINEMVDGMVTNGAKTMGTFLNKTTGKTETWATVEFSIMTHYITSCQRIVKRMMENVMRLWLQVMGIQRTAKVTHNLIDYRSDMQVQELMTARAAYAKMCVDAGFMTTEEAAAYAKREL